MESYVQHQALDMDSKIFINCLTLDPAVSLQQTATSSFPSDISTTQIAKMAAITLPWRCHLGLSLSQSLIHINFLRAKI